MSDSEKGNIYRDLGCSQEDHLPNCGHFGESGGYLSNHAAYCKSDKYEPCTCNPTARAKGNMHTDLCARCRFAMQIGPVCEGGNMTSGMQIPEDLQQEYAKHQRTVKMLGQNVPAVVAEHAIALIERIAASEQRVKELEGENAELKSTHDFSYHDGRIKSLEAQVERLKELAFDELDRTEDAKTELRAKLATATACIYSIRAALAATGDGK